MFTAPPEVAPSAAGSSPVAPVMGPSSVIVLTGPEHMRQRKLLLPPVPRRADARVRGRDRGGHQARHGGLAAGQADAPAGAHAQDHARGDPAGGVRRGGRAHGARCRQAIAGLLEPVHPLAIAAASRCAGRALERPTGAIGRALDRLDAVVYAEIARRRAPAGPGASAPTSSRCCCRRATRTVRR